MDTCKHAVFFSEYNMENGVGCGSIKCFDCNKTLYDILRDFRGKLKDLEQDNEIYKTYIGNANSTIVELDRENAELSGKIRELEYQSVHIYNSGYHAGHNDTVEGCYTDIVSADMDTYHAGVVRELRAELLAGEKYD